MGPDAFADVILPVVSGLEFEGVYMRRDDRAIRWQQAALSALGQSRTDPQIWIDLAQAMGRRDTKNPAGYWTDAFPLAWRDYGTLWDTIVVESPRGQVTGTALIEPHIRPDTIFVPNTFGPAQQVGDTFGGPRYDAVNVLVDDEYYDNLSGQQAYKCFACRISKAT